MNLNFILYLQIFLSQAPLSIPMALTTQLFDVSVSTLYLANIFDHSSFLSVIGIECVCSADESHR